MLDHLAEKISRQTLNGRESLASWRNDPSISFGPFQLFPRQRLLLEENKPVRIGSRALDILIALVMSAGEVVGKPELIAQVWPGLVVEEGNLKVHVAALRRTLCDDQCENRYISTVPGRGYCFVAPVARSDGPTRNEMISDLRRRQLPFAVGRDLIAVIAAQLSEQRFIMIVGDGDMVNSIFLAAASRYNYEDGAHFVDFAGITDPLLVPSTVSSAMQIEAGSHDPRADLITFLENRHLLLVIDNCRHIIGAISAFAADVIGRAARTHILAICR
jgi:DNA-binding winged helix-turn-helix (wHTH) protein